MTDYTHLYLCVLPFSVTNVVTVFKLKACLHTVLVTQRKCAEIAFIMEESTRTVKQQQCSVSITVLFKFLEFYLLLLYTAYS